MSGVRVRGVTKTFRSFGRRQQVLRGVDLDIQPGEVVGLIGPNGAGKTTLMSCLLGYLHADSGTITIDDLPNDHLDVRRRTGFVPERLNFDRALKVVPFLRYMGMLAGVPRDVLMPRIDTLLERLEMSAARTKKLAQLSRGMLQRVVMCQALINEPAFLFLDEPASGLDPNGVLLVREIIADQKARGAAVLLNSHQLAEVEKVCDRVFFLSGGVMQQSETLRGNAQIDVAVTLLGGEVILRTVASEAAIADLVREIVSGGGSVIDVRRQTADLEQLFREGRRE
jgi:ABC-2 type transport system ATP-binding protein